MPALQLEYQGESFNCGINKVDRAKLYGYTKTEILDDRGRPCKAATLASDGRTLISAGGLALAYVSPNGLWRDKKDLSAVDMDGKPLTSVTSTFKEVVPLTQASTIENFLDHNIRMAYELTPEGEHKIPQALLAELEKGQIYTFPFSYRGGLTPDTAFLMEGADKTVWMLVGKKTDIHFLSYEQARGFTENDEAEEDDDESLDFNMF
jgi:hypothetical protein